MSVRMTTAAAIAMACVAVGAAAADAPATPNIFVRSARRSSVELREINQSSFMAFGLSVGQD